MISTDEILERLEWNWLDDDSPANSDALISTFKEMESRVRSEALEEAAKVVDKEAEAGRHEISLCDYPDDEDGLLGMVELADHIASKIRALKEKK